VSSAPGASRCASIDRGRRKQLQGSFRLAIPSVYAERSMACWPAASNIDAFLAFRLWL